MNKPKFTPGPWRAGLSIYKSQAIVVADKGGQIADVFAYEEEQAKANAALIAAAPEMYEALADIAENCGNRGCSETCAEADCKICEILKKARGEA